MSARLPLLVLASLVAMPALPLVGTAMASQTINGDLVVDGSNVMTIDSTSTTVLGNVVVKDHGTLVVKASALVLRQDLQFQYAVRVQDQGHLVLQGGSSVGSNTFYDVLVQDQGVLTAGDSAFLGSTPSGGTKSLLKVTGNGRLAAANVAFPKMAVQLRGSSQATLDGATFDDQGELTTWDTARLDVNGGTFPLDYPNGKANDFSVLHVRNATLQGWAFMAGGHATLVVEDSTYGYPGSLFTNFLYFDDSVQVTWRNFKLVQNANFVLRGSGDYVFDHDIGMVVPSTAEVLGVSSQAHSIRVLGTEMRLGASGIGYLEVDGASKLHLSPAMTQFRMLLLVGQLNVQHLLAREGSTIDVVSQGDVITVGQLNDACLKANILPVGTNGYAQQYYGIPVPGAGVFVPSEVDQTLTVHVKDAGGNAVPGATVSLSDALGNPVNVYDPASDTATPTRATDASGTAQYLFAPTGVLDVKATAGGASGSAQAITAGCASVDVTVK